MSRARQFVSSTPFDTVEIELPSQRKVLVRRPPMMAWAVAGTVPPFFTTDVREAWARTQNEPVESLDDLPPERLADALRIVRALAMWAFVDPVLREGATGDDDAVDPSFLTLDDWNFLGPWFMKGSPDVPVATNSGEAMTVEAVRNFRDGQRREDAVSPGEDGGEIRSDTEQSDRIE
jgi:hypothetical protein